MNYTYVCDVMRVWQGPEVGYTGSSFIQRGSHVKCFQIHGKYTREARYAQLCSSALHRPKARDQPGESFK